MVCSLVAKPAILSSLAACSSIFVMNCSSTFFAFFWMFDCGNVVSHSRAPVSIPRSENSFVKRNSTRPSFSRDSSLKGSGAAFESGL